MGFVWLAGVPSWEHKRWVASGKDSVGRVHGLRQTRVGQVGKCLADRRVVGTSAKTTRLRRLNSFEFMGNSDLESSGLIMRCLGWSGENDL